MREIHHLALMVGDQIVTADGDPVGTAERVDPIDTDRTRVTFPSGIEATFSGNETLFIAAAEENTDA